MSYYADKIVMVVGVVAIVLLVGFQSAGLLSSRREMSEKIVAARKLAAEVKGHEFAALEKDPAGHSGRVFKAWEELPLAESLTVWDFYPKPGRKRR